MQGAFLAKTHLQGATSKHVDNLSFVERIRLNIDQESDLSEVMFAGGLSREDVDSLIQDLPDKIAKQLRKELEPHVGKPASNELPEDSDTIVGSYTAEEAERWIAEYAEAMGESPAAGG